VTPVLQEHSLLMASVANNVHQGPSLRQAPLNVLSVQLDTTLQIFGILLVHHALRASIRLGTIVRSALLEHVQTQELKA